MGPRDEQCENVRLAEIAEHTTEYKIDKTISSRLKNYRMTTGVLGGSEAY
jgi:hypothetical protein